MRIDLHTHSWASDGTDSPTRLVLNARQANLDVIAITDHDTFAGVDEARQAGRRIGVHVLGGVELSTRFEGHDVHLLGYGPRLDNQPLNVEMAKMRTARTQRLPAMIEKLAGLGLEITMDEVRAQAGGAGTSLGRPHLADAMVARGYVAHRDEAFNRYLDRTAPAYVPRSAVDLAVGIQLLHGAGAAAVIAHPGIRGVGEVLTGELLEALAREHGLDGIEVDYPLHDPSTRDLFHRLGARLDLVRTGGSDHHGLGKVDHELGCRLTREPAYRELLRRIAGHGGVTN